MRGLPVQFSAALPAGLPVSVAEIKQRQRIETDAEDALLSGLIAAAVTLVETRTRRLLVRRAATMALPAFPAAGAPLPLRGGVVAAQPVVTWRRAGVTDAIAADDMEFAPDALPPCIAMAGGAGWPAPDAFGWPVTVSYDAGYPPVGDDLGARVPDALKQAIGLMVGEMYERREQAVIGATVSRAMIAAEDLMAPFVAGWIG